MIAKLLTEHHLEFLSFKGGCTGSSVPNTCQNATLLEITCHGLCNQSTESTDGNDVL